MKYVSGRVKELKVGITSYTEEKTPLSVIGNVNITGDIISTGVGITNLNVSGVSTFTGAIDANGDLDVDGHTELDNVNVSGIATFTDVIDSNGRIVGAATSNVIPFLYNNFSDLPSAGTYHGAFAHVHATQRAYFAHGGAWYQLINQEANGTVGTGTERYNVGHIDGTSLNISGLSTFAGVADFNNRIVGLATDNVIPFLYNNYSDLPSAVTYHGAFAHVHETGKAYYAHAANWYELVNKELNGTVGTGTEKYDIGITSVTSLYVSGISTYDGNLDVQSSVLITGITTVSGSLDINAGGQANTFKVEDLTDNRVVIVGTGGELEDDANLTFNGTTFNVGSAITMYQASGIISATAFYGDGSGLENTGATLSAASGTQRLVLTSLTSGTMTSAATDADLSFDATTNLLSAGKLLVAGISTFNDNVNLPDNKKIQLGDNGDLQLYDDGTHGYLKKFGGNALFLDAAQVTIGSTDNLKISVRANPDTHTALYYNNSKRLETTGYGVTVFGTTQTQQINVSGVATATTFSGDLTGTVNTAAQPNITSVGTLSAVTVSGNINANGDIVGDSVTNITGISGVSASTLTGTLQTAAQTNITSVGTLGALTVSGNINANQNIIGDGATNIHSINNVSASTFNGTLQTAAQPNVTSLGTLSSLNITGNVTSGSAVLGSAKVSDLTDNRLVIAGTAGELEDTSKLTFDGTTLAIVGNATFTGNVSVAGTLTSEDKTNIDSIGIVTARTGVRISSGGLVVTSGVSTFTDAIDSNGGADISGTLNANDDVNLGNANSTISAVGRFDTDVVPSADGAKDLGLDAVRWRNLYADVLHGDGSQLTGITAAGTGAIGGLTVKDEGVTVGTAGSVSTFDFRGATITAIANTGAAGIATVTVITEQNQNIQTLNVSGLSTFTGTAEFDGNAEFDGFVSSNNSAVTVKNPQFLQINNDAHRLRLKGTGTAGAVESIALQLNTNAEGGSTQHALVANENSSVKIYHSGNQKLETTSSGVTVTGTCQATDFNSTSDARLKTNVQTITSPLDKINQIDGVTFEWITDNYNKPSAGVIADTVEKVFPELIGQTLEVSDKDETRYKTVNYNGLIGLLIEAVKEQQVQITELKTKLDSLS